MYESSGILPFGPSRPMRIVDLDEWHDAAPESVQRVARDAQSELSLTVGVATRRPPAHLRPLWQALTVALAGPGTGVPDRCFVSVPDCEEALAKVVRTVRHQPQACVALGQLLRQTSHLDILPGLAAEAAVYSMLLSGTEFHAWLADRGAPRTAVTSERPLVRLHRDESRLSVVLDHPERRNALSFGMREALFEALETAVIDDIIAEVDLSGAGPAFCSGGDLAEFGTANDLVAAYLVRLDRAPWRLIARIHERVNVRVHGAAVGAGIEMAAFARRVVAAPDTFFLLPEASMGLVPGAGGTVSVSRRIGRWRTAWMVLSGENVDSATALAWGLVDEITPP
ncbi:MAG: enoyl-CoA hydratase/isomerase family protein [Actinophytocola sp.]|nr:enoyl-CoA hydratase/isomerase family protein [Actinophytocola sp.]